MTNPFRCDECGQFISYEDIALGYAEHYELCPATYMTIETWMTTCRKCLKAQQNELSDQACS